MSIICAASYCTDENKRLRYAKKMFKSLLETVDFNKHRLGIYLNSPNKEAEVWFEWFKVDFCKKFKEENLEIVLDRENVGTAKAVNFLMSGRKEGETCIKMDDDVVVNKTGWVDEMEEVLQRMPEIYILGLKRRDLWESTYRTDAWKSELLEVRHEAGQRNFVVERCAHVMGTATMFSLKCLEEIGGLYQVGTYSLDDSDIAARVALHGKMSCFLHGIDIDHLDEGNDFYTEWKRKYAGERMEEYNKTIAEYKSGITPLYRPFI